MVVTNRLLAATLAVTGLLPYALGDTTAALGKDTRPSVEIAKSRAPQIFNAVHDSMRQWGASLHHNGMSFFLATVPEGVIFHHGNNQQQSPLEPDWLAYEIEHAENFARGGRGPGGGPGGGPGKGPGNGGPPGGPPPPPGSKYDAEQIRLDRDRGAQHELRRRSKDGSALEEQKGGWLHTYRATRPLLYLYIDGMSGGKTELGTLDSQDYLFLRKNKEGNDDKGPMWGERQRAVQLCALAQDWGLDGVIRMEAGFEIIQCDFANGLDQLQALQRPPPSSNGGGGGGGPPGGRGSFGSFEYIRGLAERYHDIGSSRTIVDYSSMVSAYFFPLNLTNPDPKRPDLARLVNNTDAALDPLRAYLNETIRARLGKPVRTIDWQDVTDIIVGRYADRVKYMAEKTTKRSALLNELNVLLTAFIDYSSKAQDQDRIAPSIERCANFYLHAVEPETEADEFIFAAIQTVTTELCTRLFEVRELVESSPADSDADESDDDDVVVAQAVAKLRSLLEYLAWARFKRCPSCDVDEVCFIPMWPMGSKEAYESPRCVTAENMDEGESYWGRGPGFGRPGRGRPDDGKGGQDGKRHHS